MKLLATAILAFLTASPVLAAPNCASNKDAYSILTEMYEEAPVARGVDNKGQIVTFWGNTDTGSWTATVTVGDQTCIVAQGGQFERLALAPNV